MKNLQILVYNLISLDLDLELKETFTDQLETNDKIYAFENKWIRVEIQTVNNEFNQYTLYPVICKFNSRDFEDLKNGVSIYLVKEIKKYLNEVVENFDKQEKIIEELLKDKMKLKRHYDLTDEWYKKKNKE